MKGFVDLANLLLEESKRLEPCDAEVIADETEEMKVVFENSDFSVASSSKSTVFGLRTIVKNRLGFVTTNSLEPQDLKDKAKEAQMVASLSPESPHQSIARSAKPISEIWVDERLEKAGARQILGWAEEFVSESRKDPRVAIDRAELSLVNYSRTIQNSFGINQYMKQSLCYWSIMGMAKDKDEVTSFDHEGEATSTFSELQSKLKSCAKTFSESVLGSLGATSGQTYKGPVLLHPAAVSSLLVGLIDFNVNGRYQQDGMSQWAGKMGQTVAHSAFSLLENPLDKTRATAWTPFDREGIEAIRHDVIKDGVLKFTAHNCFSAKRAGVASTGNATGGARSLPSIGLRALSVGAGKSSEAELYSALNNGLVIKRFSGNSDPVSGQFSGIAKNSWWVKNGKRHAPLKEVMVSGNMFDLLKNIKLVGSDIHRQSGYFDSPYILIDGVSVTAG